MDMVISSRRRSLTTLPLGVSLALLNEVSHLHVSALCIKTD